MATLFVPNKQLTPGDLNLLVRDEHGMLYDPYMISFSIFQVVDGQQILALGPKLSPQKYALGNYWINIMIPTGWCGEYQVVWYMTKTSTDDEVAVYEDFSIIVMDLNKTSHEAPSLGMASALVMTPKTANMVAMVRELLSDENPDRNYHFRPPTAGKTIAGFSQRVGFIWEDKTIIRMLALAISQLNTSNPLMNYGYTLDNIPTDWGYAAAVGAAAKCLSKEAFRWAGEEFSYSLNGVSVDINKAQLYQGLAESLSAEFREWAIPIAATKPKSVGLRQSHFLI